MSSPRAIIVAHASLAAGLVSAVDAITGRAGTLHSVSNVGLGAKDLYETIARALDETGVRVVFTDLPAGSCAFAVRRLLRERAGLSVVTGVNLPMLLEFAVRDDEPLAALPAAVARGREHVHVLESDVR